MHIRDCHNPKCGVAFPVKSPGSTQRYCSRSCAAVANAAKRKPKVKKNRKALRQTTGLIILPAQVSQPLLTLTCSHCKTSFTKRRRERFCSSMCRSFAEHTKPLTNVIDLHSVEEVSLPDPLQDPDQAM